MALVDTSDDGSLLFIGVTKALLCKCTKATVFDGGLEWYQCKIMRLSGR